MGDITLPRAELEQALRWADQHGEVVYSGGGWDAVNGMNKWAQALRSRLAQPDRIQLTVRDFVVTVGDIEDAVGTPMYWAEWPNKEQP